MSTASNKLKSQVDVSNRQRLSKVSGLSPQAVSMQLNGKRKNKVLSHLIKVMAQKLEALDKDLKREMDKISTTLGK